MKVFAISSNIKEADGSPFNLQLGVDIHTVGCQECRKFMQFQEGYWAEGRQIFRGLSSTTIK